MPILGRILIFGATAYLGFAHAMHLRHKLLCLRALTAALQTMARELSFSLTPIPELLRCLAATEKGRLRDFFCRCEAAFLTRDEEHFRDIWSRMLRESGLPLDAEALRVLDRVGEVLGRYDAESQREGILYAQEQLEKLGQAAAEDSVRLGRLSVVLGCSLGAFLIILL